LAGDRPAGFVEPFPWTGILCVHGCLDLLTGESQWETDRVGHAGVLVADGKLILFNDEGELILARANSERYEELARAAVLAGEICWTPPALDRGRIYVRNQSQAACVFIGRPELMEEAQSRSLMTVADIPQGKYHNLAAMLGVEPEYAFDVPSNRWLVNWFFTGLGLLAVAAVLAITVKLGRRIALRQELSERAAWWWFWGTAFVLGALGTTPLSLWRAEFVFTWPVSLFVAFQATSRQVRLGRTTERSRGAGWRARLVALGFIGICVAYYLLCRRLSLVFEWAFLSGFAAAVPVAIAGVWLAHRAPRRLPVAVIATVAEFAAYYWGLVAWLWWKYPTSA
jgi:hypothetical protein